MAGTKAMPGIGSFWVPTDVQPCLILGLLVALEHVCREKCGEIFAYYQRVPGRAAALVSKKRRDYKKSLTYKYVCEMQKQ